MDRLSSLMVRTSLLWLLLGVVLGGLMLTDEPVPGNWRLWAAPTHGHVLFVGWFVQFVIGVAYWLFPRRRSPERPLGYDERAALAAVAALNLGLALRLAAEPAERVDPDAGWTVGALGASSVLQIAAVALFVVQLWPRVGPRQVRARSADAATAETR